MSEKGNCKTYGARLTWNDLADIYQSSYGGIVRIKPMQDVFDAVAKLPFIVLDDEGYLHRIITTEE